MSNGEFEEFLNKLNELKGQHEIRFSKLFVPEFMEKYTAFSTIEELLQASTFDIKTNEDFKNIPDKEWDEFIKETTEFSSWEEMVKEAGDLWTTRQLGID